jgi:TRAP-type C4-dicarboxylate transport system permease small subunit
VTGSPTAPAPAGAQALLDGWHRAECAIAVAAFGFIAVVLIADVAGRELLTPLFKALGMTQSDGIYAAQKMCVYALVVGSFCGIGIATATASHLLPRIGFGWVPESFGQTMNRIADLVTGVFFCGVAWYGWVYVQSSMQAGLRAQAFDIPIWPIQLAIPAGFLSAAVRYFLFAAWPALRPLPPEFQE